jgi:hypothetical protein
LQIIFVVILGSMAFTSANFWLALFMQELQHLDPLTVALHLLPQAIAGIVWNIIAGNILHVVNNTLIMAVGAACYLTACLLLSFMRPESIYWAFVFPALVLNVVGADFQFNVANVSGPETLPDSLTRPPNVAQMYVMQALPSHQQALAGGIFNTLIRLGTTVALGISTAVYTSADLSDPGIADPTLKFQRAFQVSVGLAGASILFVPLLRLGTQGNSPSGKRRGSTETAETTTPENDKS